MKKEMLLKQNFELLSESVSCELVSLPNL